MIGTAFGHTLVATGEKITVHASRADGKEWDYHARTEPFGYLVPDSALTPADRAAIKRQLAVISANHAGDAYMCRRYSAAPTGEA